MVQVDIPIAFGVSCFFTDMARRQLQQGGPIYYYHTLSQTVIFQAFFFSWIPLYFLMNFFGWETTHMWWHADDITAYPFFIPMFVILFWLSAFLGFYVGSRLVVEGQLWANRIIYLGILLFTLIWIFAQPGNTMRLGTYTEWKAGLAPWFYESGTFLFMFILVMIIWIAGIVWFAIRLWRIGNHLDIL